MVGFSSPAAMVSNLCIDKKFDLIVPRVPSFPTIGAERMVSKQELFAPSDVQVNLHCTMLISSAACTHSMTKISLQLLVRRFGPDRSSDGKFHAIPGTGRCYNWPTKFSQKDVKCIKLFLVHGTGDHLQNKPLLTRKHWNIPASHVWKLFCPALSVRSFRTLSHVVSEINVLLHTSTSRQHASWHWFRSITFKMKPSFVKSVCGACATLVMLFPQCVTLVRCPQVGHPSKVHGVTKIAARQGSGWLQAHNECSIVLPNSCLYDACVRGTCIGNPPAWGTTWVSQRASDWRTFIIDCEFGGGWIVGGQHPYLYSKFRLDFSKTCFSPLPVFWNPSTLKSFSFDRVS